MCDYPRCRNRDTSDGVIYYGYDLCNRCWVRACVEGIDLKTIFNIAPEYPSAAEELDRGKHYDKKLTAY